MSQVRPESRNEAKWVLDVFPRGWQTGGRVSPELFHLSSSDSQLNRLTHNAFKPLCLSLRPSLHLCLSLVLVYITFPTLLSSSLLFPVPFFYVTLSLFVTNSRCTHSKGVPLLLRGGAMKLQCPLVAHCRHSRVSHAAIYSMFLIFFVPSFW